MTAIILNIAYLITLLAAAPWLAYQSVFRGKYRAGFAAKFWGAVPQRNSARPCIWLHAVSVGEVNLLAVLLKEIAQYRPDIECVISTTTKTGYVLAASKYSQHTVFYCPLDFSWAVRRALKQIRPNVLLLAELELWPNLIRIAKENRVRVAIVNGRLSEKSFRGYRRIRRWLTGVLNSLDVIAVQNDEYAHRFLALAVEERRVHITGSLKFDGAQGDRQNAKTQTLQKLAGFSNDDVVFLAGSTQAPEEELALAAFQSLAGQFPKLRLIIVPRHPHRFDEVAALLDRSEIAWTRRSALSSNIPHSAFPNLQSNRVLLVDTVGELGAWWGTATIGFVGGSLFCNRGGQNMIEPAAYGVATCFGPNTKNFRDVVSMLLTHAAAVRVGSGEELAGFVRRCLSDSDYARELGCNAAELVKAQQGATARTWALIEPLLPPRVVATDGVQRSAA